MRQEKDQALIFELSKQERVGHSLPDLDIDEMNLDELLPAEFVRQEDANDFFYINTNIKCYFKSQCFDFIQILSSFLLVCTNLYISCHVSS